MELNDSIYTYLASVAALTSLTSTRIYPDRQKQKTSYTFPYITYQMLSEYEVDTIKEQTNMLIASTYEFTVWASTRTSAKAVAKQLRKAFKGFKGVMGGAGGVTISAIEKINAYGDTTEEGDGGTLTFREAQEFEIWHYETT